MHVYFGRIRIYGKADSYVFRCSWGDRNKKKRRMGNSAKATPIWSAACCTELRCVAVNSGVYMWAFTCKGDFYLVYCVLQCVAVCCSVLHCVAVSCSVLNMTVGVLSERNVDAMGLW